MGSDAGRAETRLGAGHALLVACLARVNRSQWRDSIESYVTPTALGGQRTCIIGLACRASACLRAGTALLIANRARTCGSERRRTIVSIRASASP